MSAAPLYKTAPDFYATARFNMVESQIKPNKIVNPKLIAAFENLPREAFVPEVQKPFAYSDQLIAIGSDRQMLTPMVLARMIQELDPQPHERVLDVGAGTGYAAAILNELAGETVALETDGSLLRLLQQNKQVHELQQVSAVNGTLCDGFAPASPFQAILIEGGIQWMPQKLIHQLAEGGRLVCIFYPEGDLFGQMGEMQHYIKKDGVMEKRTVMDAAAPILPGFNARATFRF